MTNTEQHIVIQLTESDDLYHHVFDSKEQALNFINESNTKCYLISVDAGHCCFNVDIKIEPYT